MKRMITVLTMFLIVVAAGCSKATTQEINSFEDCIAAGYPRLESYPEQCKTPDGRTFVQEVGTQLTEKEWKTDGVTLKKIPDTGELACFGCGATMCIDPIPGLEEVEETLEQHCNQDFEIVWE